MTSQCASTSEASQQDDASTLPIQNSVARNYTANPAPSTTTTQSSSSSKRSNAAQLARDLASSSPWSDTFVPQTYGTLSPRPVPAIAEAAARQESESMAHNIAQAEQYSDPPPAYTRNPLPSGIPSTQEAPVMTTTSDSAVSAIADIIETQRLPITDIEQNQHIHYNAPDVETPLLTQPCATQITRGRPRWIWRRKTKNRKCCRILCTVLLSSIIAAILVCLLVSRFEGATSFFDRPIQPSQPWVPTSSDYERHETTADISGAYKLYNKVELTTGTGSIDVEIEPQPCDTPAILILSTVSGSVTVRITAEYLRRIRRLQRTIHTEIRSFSGSIVAELVLGHGGSAFVETQVGGQILSVLTSGVGPTDEISNLTTFSGTGTQKVVLTSLESEHEYVSNIRGVHHSFASLDITYPASWLGTVHAASTPFGLASVTGDDLTYMQQDRDNIVAYRGSGHNLTLTEVVSDGPGRASFKTSKRDNPGSVL